MKFIAHLFMALLLTIHGQASHEEPIGPVLRPGPLAADPPAQKESFISKLVSSQLKEFGGFIEGQVIEKLAEAALGEDVAGALGIIDTTESQLAEIQKVQQEILSKLTEINTEIDQEIQTVALNEAYAVIDSRTDAMHGFFKQLQSGYYKDKKAEMKSNAESIAEGIAQSVPEKVELMHSTITGSDTSKAFLGLMRAGLLQGDGTDIFTLAVKLSLAVDKLAGRYMAAIDLLNFARPKRTYLDVSIAKIRGADGKSGYLGELFQWKAKMVLGNLTPMITALLNPGEVIHFETDRWRSLAEQSSDTGFVRGFRNLLQLGEGTNTVLRVTGKKALNPANPGAFVVPSIEISLAPDFKPMGVNGESCDSRQEYLTNTVCDEESTGKIIDVDFRAGSTRWMLNSKETSGISDSDTHKFCHFRNGCIGKYMTKQGDKSYAWVPDSDDFSMWMAWTIKPDLSVHARLRLGAPAAVPSPLQTSEEDAGKICGGCSPQ